MNENQMPGMPGMDTNASTPSMDSGATLTPPSHEGDSNKEAENETQAPVELQRPEINRPESEISNNVEAPMIPKEGIKVVALRKGFYNQNRIREGDKFIVKSFKQLGEWMRCEDKDLEEKRKEMLKNKKARK